MNNQQIPFTIIDRHLYELGVEIKFLTYFLSHYDSWVCQHLLGHPHFHKSALCLLRGAFSVPTDLGL
jgi:hypothetical protein